MEGVYLGKFKGVWVNEVLGGYFDRRHCDLCDLLILSRLSCWLWTLWHEIMVLDLSTQQMLSQGRSLWSVTPRSVFVQSGFVVFYTHVSPWSGKISGVTHVSILGQARSLVCHIQVSSWSGVISGLSHSCLSLSLIHIWRCRRADTCRSRCSPYH